MPYEYLLWKHLKKNSFKETKAQILHKLEYNASPLKITPIFLEKNKRTKKNDPTKCINMWECKKIGKFYLYVNYGYCFFNITLHGINYQLNSSHLMAVITITLGPN